MTARDLELVDGYRVVALLGEGGMSAVYLAHDLRDGREVAIKLLAADLAHDATLVARFRAETAALVAARGPGVVEVLALGALPDGRPYVVLECLRGETLGAWLRARGCCTVDDALTITAALAQTLDELHRRGAIHRDLTPDNVFLLHGDPARIVLVDLGAAPAATDDGDVVVGTPAYMAPEQCGDGPVDHRADLYALGCILFELVAGHPPFDGAEPEEILRAHLDAAPPHLRDHAPGVPACLDALCANLLAKRPADRVASAAALCAWLAADAPTVAATTWSCEPTTTTDAARTVAPPWPRWWIARSFIAVLVLRACVASPSSPSTAPPSAAIVAI